MTARSEDAAIVRDLAAGEASAPARLIRRKLGPILALCTRLLGDLTEAEDVTQEVLVRACREARARRPGPEKFDVFLTALAVELCRRRRAARRERTCAVLPERTDPAPQPEEALIQSERRMRVRAALDALPQPQREALVLCHFQGLSNIDAAAVLGLSIEALESRLARGRRGLKGALSDLL